MSGGVLSLIWTLALVLVASAFAVLGALIVARLRREALDRLDPDRRARISSALKQFAITGARPTIAVANTLDRQILVEVALSSAQLMRGAARGRLVQYLRDIGFDQKMRRQALRGTMRDRLAAIEALRLFPDQQTTSTLQRCESDRDLRISLAALHTRCEMGFGPDMLGLLEIAARPGAGRSPHMQDLVEARAAANLPEALRVLSGRLPDPARVLLIRAIGETGARAALGPLKVALHHPYPEVRAAAAGSLGALGSGEAAEALARATRDADWRVRLRAAEAIGRLGLWRQAQALEPLLEDDVWWVRFRAEEALQRLSGIALSHLNTAASALHSAAANDKLRSAPT